MYWADAYRDRVETARLDGSARRQLIYEDGAHYFALSLDMQYLYITDWRHRCAQSQHWRFIIPGFIERSIQIMNKML